MHIKTSQRQSGFITPTIVILLLIMVILAGVSTATAVHLRREVKLLEKQQVQRLAK